MGCVILLWHSLGLPYNYFVNVSICNSSYFPFWFQGQDFDSVPGHCLPSTSDMIYKLKKLAYTMSIIIN